MLCCDSIDAALYANINEWIFLILKSAGYKTFLMSDFFSGDTGCIFSLERSRLSFCVRILQQKQYRFQKCSEGGKVLFKGGPKSNDFYCSLLHAPAYA